MLHEFHAQLHETIGWKDMREKALIRPLEENDLPAVGHILADTWRSTFRGLLPDSYLDGLSASHQSQRVSRLLRQGGSACFVAVTPESEVAAYAGGGLNRGPEPAVTFELYAIYVNREHQGLGIGRRLFHAVAQALTAKASGSLIVWALTINPCRSFYERLGGRNIATGMTELGGTSFEMVGYFWKDLRTAVTGEPNKA